MQVFYCLFIYELLLLGWVGITLTGLTPPHFCARLKLGPGFPMSYVVIFFVQRDKGRCDFSFC